MAVKVTLDIKKTIKELNSSRTQKEIADTIIKEMKKSIAIGLSPVKGVGRFSAYRAVERKNNQKKTGIKATNYSKGYPFSIQSKYPGKTVRPVNLSLSGRMLDSMTYRVSSNKLTIGIFGDEAKKAETHNDGTQSPKVPRRQFIPNDNGDEFITSIQTEINNIYSNALNAIILKSK